MKPFVAMFALLTIGAAAQETAQPGISTASAPAMGKTVKGAPYWADEITESLQVLADGTRISHQSKATVYRDSLGRVRRESPDKITIFDTVTGYSYTLDPKSMTVERLTMGTLLMNRQKLFFFRKSAAPSPEATAKAKAELDANVAELKANLAQLGEALPKLAKRNNPLTESLGQQVIEGLTADGTRATETIETGEVGNDRPIHIAYETWISPDLQTVLMTKHTDPRTGEETFRLVNVHVGEPAANLFVVPADYKER
jgi:hypothetical protein